MKNNLSKLLALMFMLVSSLAFAQNESVAALSGVQATPKDGLEFGIHGGYFFSSGDLNPTPSFGTGIHFRKALDYVFSIRVDGFYGVAKGDGTDSGHQAVFGQDLNNMRPYSFETTVLSGGVQGVMSLNNLRWDSGLRKLNFYFFLGGSGAYVKTPITATDASSETAEDVYIPGRNAENFVPAFNAGAGLAFKLSPKVNLAIEHKVNSVFGKRADLLDGFDQRWRDIGNYTNVRINFNITKGGKLAEPLYWVNPMEVILDDVADLKARPVLDLNDADEDGVIDLIDQDNETPEGVTVDAKGVAMDSDNDGVPDYKDGEPFSDRNVAVNGDGISDKGMREGDFVTRDEVNEMINQNSGSKGNGSGGSVDFGSWFLPSINFNEDSYKLRVDDYAKLASIATVMNKNAGMKVVVKGYTDRTAGPTYNEVLSYKRSNAAIEYLVEKYNISRDRFILQYGGEDEALVPVEGSSFINRRVTFTVAESTDLEMPAPSGAGGSGYKGKKGQGY